MGLLVLALFAVITGVILLPSYSATGDGAHRSVAAIQASAPLRVIRAAHHWASALLLLLGGAYLVYGLFLHCYRRPWHLAWIAAVGLVLIFFGFQLTGHLLPWDRHAVSSSAIEAGIAANVPVVGPMQGELVRGGSDTVSPRTLRAWYIAHVGLLPLALAGLAALFILQMRRLGGALNIPRRGVGVALGLLVLAAILIPAPLGPQATPADYTSFAAPPEWYVLPLHGLLNLAQRIQPNLAFLGTVVIPGLVVLCLLALPWLDRKTIHHPPSGAVRGLVGVGVVLFLVLTLANVGHVAPPFAPGGPRMEPAGSASGATANVPLDPALIEKGKSLFAQNGCTGCHKVGGQGGAVGPPLDSEGKRRPDLDWQLRHLKEPAAVVSGSTMPAYKQLTDADLKALATYLLSLK